MTVEDTIIQLILLFGIPTAITSLGSFLIKRRVERGEAEAKEREQNLESLVLMMIQSSRANSVGITAIARAIQRIPDAHCNGDMKEALEKMEKIQTKEQQFITDKGIKYLFE